MFQDMDKIFIGSGLMFTFMLLVLSKFGWLEIRLLLACMGLFSVGMAFTSAIGLCSVLGISYGPVHTSLPFLLMGLGIDDMFVMMTCWRNLQRMEETQKMSIPDRMGLMLQAAGSSITVTSFTDIVAFSVGSITVRSETGILYYCLPLIEFIFNLTNRFYLRFSHSVYIRVSVFYSFTFMRSHFSRPFLLSTKNVFLRIVMPSCRV